MRQNFHPALGTHAFIPRAFKLGEVPTCQCCPCTAAHPVHDWLSPITPEELVQLPNLPTHDAQEAINAQWAARDAQQPDSSQPPIEEVL